MVNGYWLLVNSYWLIVIGYWLMPAPQGGGYWLNETMARQTILKVQPACAGRLDRT